MLPIFVWIRPIYLLDETYFPEPDGSADTSVCPQCSAQSWHLAGALFQLVPQAKMLMRWYKDMAMWRFPSWPNSSPIPKCVSSAMRLNSLFPGPLDQGLALFVNAVWQKWWHDRCKQYMYLSTWLSPEPLLSLVSFPGDNMNHISDVFITWSSSNSFTFNCCLIFHFMNKSQDSSPFPYWRHIGWNFLLTQKIMGIYSHAKIFRCVPSLCMDETSSHVYASKSWNIHTSHIEILLNCFPKILDQSTLPPVIYENSHFSLFAIT